MPGNTVTLEGLNDLHGKVVIVTGSSGGLGYAIVQLLAKKGAKVYMAARNKQKSLDAIKQLEADGIADGHIEWLNLDLSHPEKAKASAEEFLKIEKRLDILVNNAAISVGTLKSDENGLSDMMVTNHISPFVFTKTLIPLMKTTSKEDGADVRIVNISSGAHTEVEITSYSTKADVNKDFGDSFRSGFRAYGHSKLANILHAKELQKRFDAEGTDILCISLHPGAVHTPGSSNFLGNIPYIGSLFKLIGRLFFAAASDAALTPAFAAASPEVRQEKEKYKGAYLVPVAQVVAPSKSAQNDKLATELYDTTEAILKELDL